MTNPEVDLVFSSIMHREMPHFCLPANIVWASFNDTFERLAGEIVDGRKDVGSNDIVDVAGELNINVGEEAEFALQLAVTRQLDEYLESDEGYHGEA